MLNVELRAKLEPIGYNHDVFSFKIQNSKFNISSTASAMDE
jgi:hypothetical protein